MPEEGEVPPGEQYRAEAGLVPDLTPPKLSWPRALSMIDKDDGFRKLS